MQISAVNMPEWPINLQNVADIWPLIYVMAVFWVFDGKRETKDDLTVFLTNDFWLSIFIFSMLKGIYMGIRGIYNGRKLIFNCHLSMRLSKVCKVPLPLIEKIRNLLIISFEYMWFILMMKLETWFVWGIHMWHGTLLFPYPWLNEHQKLSQANP